MANWTELENIAVAAQAAVKAAEQVTVDQCPCCFVRQEEVAHDENCEWIKLKAALDVTSRFRVSV